MSKPPAESPDPLPPPRILEQPPVWFERCCTVVILLLLLLGVGAIVSGIIIAIAP